MTLPRTAVELGGDPTETSYSTATAVDRIIRNQKTAQGHTYIGIPEPQDTTESLQQTVAALKEVVETLTGQRGDSSLHALKIGQAAELNDGLLEYISAGDDVSTEVVEEVAGWAHINPNQTTDGEYSYRGGRRGGIRVFLNSGTPSFTIEREVGSAIPSGWVGTNSAYYISIEKRIIHAPGDRPIVAVPTGWTSGAGPNTGEPGYYTYQWVDRDGNALVAPTNNVNSVVVISVRRRLE